MTSRERWTVYPLLFMALGFGFKNGIDNQADHESFDGRLVRSKEFNGKEFNGDVVRCKELVVVNESDKPVVQVSTNKTGAGIVQTANSNGTFQVVLTADSAGGVLRLLDVNGHYFQFPAAERRPLTVQPADEPNSDAEHSDVKGDRKAEK